MDKIYSALDVAAYCVNCCIDFERPVSNLQLQKILYYAQANFLCKKDRPCFKENIVNWKYGPVVEEVYEKYKKNGSANIFTKVEGYEYLKIIRNDDGNLSFKKEIDKVDFNSIELEDKELLNTVCDKFSQISGYDLIGMTHEEAPWLNTENYEIITNESIKEYFDANAERL